jgi:hypothetical protein
VKIDPQCGVVEMFIKGLSGNGAGGGQDGRQEYGGETFRHLNLPAAFLSYGIVPDRGQPFDGNPVKYIV